MVQPIRTSDDMNPTFIHAFLLILYERADAQALKLELMEIAEKGRNGDTFQLKDYRAVLNLLQSIRL